MADIPADVMHLRRQQRETLISLEAWAMAAPQKEVAILDWVLKGISELTHPDLCLHIDPCDPETLVCKEFYG